MGLTDTTDNFKIQNNSALKNIEILNRNLDKENICWIELSKRIRSWDKNVYQRILRRSNPAEKKILKILKDIDPDNPANQIDFESRDFQRLIQASFEYDEKNK